MRAAVVIDGGLDPLLPPTALLREPVTQPTCMRRSGRCPRATHDSEIRPAIRSSRRCRTSARSFFTRFVFPRPRRRLRPLGEMHTRTDPLQLVDNEPPAGCGLQRHFELVAIDAPGTDPTSSPVITRARHTSPMLVPTHRNRIKLTHQDIRHQVELVELLCRELPPGGKPFGQPRPF